MLIIDAYSYHSLMHVVCIGCSVSLPSLSRRWSLSKTNYKWLPGIYFIFLLSLDTVYLSSLLICDSSLCWTQLTASWLLSYPTMSHSRASSGRQWMRRSLSVTATAFTGTGPWHAYLYWMYLVSLSVAWNVKYKHRRYAKLKPSNVRCYLQQLEIATKVEQ